MNDNQFEQFKTRMAIYSIIIVLISAACGFIIGYSSAIENGCK